MSYGLDLARIPQYGFSSFRYFEAHEKHVNRICSDDVIVIVFGGVLKFHEGGRPVEVSAGEYYIQEKEILQEGVEESKYPEYYYIHFRGDFTDGQWSMPLRGKADFAELFPLFRQLDLLELTEASLAEREVIFLQILMVLMRRDLQTEQSKVVQDILARVAKDLRQPFSLEEVAARTGYCKNYIIELFKSQMGETPYAYVTRIRLERACQLLQHSASSMGQIAGECGFGTYVNFYKAFYKAYQCSPVQWRKKVCGK